MRITPLVLLLVTLPGCGSGTTPAKPTAITDQLALGDKITNSIGMVLVPIPAGEFQMGSSSSAEEIVKRFDIPESMLEYMQTILEDEKPQHLVEITKPFYLSVYGVTQQQYENVMGVRPWEGKKPVREGPDYPAVYVSWDDATKFCRKLSEQEGVEYRLPTEAQWEYACRAGTTTIYSFGDDASELGQHAWYKAKGWDNQKNAERVGQKLPNAWGLYDMHGNVWEWCQDWYSPYGSEKTVSDPMGPAQGENRVIRGGSFQSVPYHCRSARRHCFPEDLSPTDKLSYGVGFRVARTYN